MYASRLRADPIETYRQVDVASRLDGASPHRLVGLLYDELLASLRLAALAIEKGDHTIKSARVTKAVAVLFALEAGLDYERGGGVAEALSAFYRGARAQVMRASVELDAALIREVITNVGEIAASWRSIGGR